MGLYDYMTADDSYYASLNAVFENKIAKLNAEFEKLMLEHEMNLIDIETAVLCESTDSTLYALYEAEAQETQKKGKGIIGSIIDAIRRFIHKIKVFLFGENKITEDNVKDSVEVIDVDKTAKEINEDTSKLKQFLAGNKGVVGKIATGIGIGIGAVGAKTLIKVAGKKNVFNVHKKAEAVANQTDKDLAEIEKTAEGKDMTPDEQSWFKSTLNRVKSKMQDIFETEKSLQRKIDKEEAKQNAIRDKAQTEDEATPRNEEIKATGKAIKESEKKIKNLDKQHDAERKVNPRLSERDENDNLDIADKADKHAKIQAQIEQIKKKGNLSESDKQKIAKLQNEDPGMPGDTSKIDRQRDEERANYKKLQKQKDEQIMAARKNSENQKIYKAKIEDSKNKVDELKNRQRRKLFKKIINQKGDL